MKKILFLLLLIPYFAFGQGTKTSYDTVKLTYLKALKPALQKIYVSDTLVLKDGQKQISAFTETLKSNLGTAYNLSHSHSNYSALGNIISNGDGSRYLANDGTYKVVSGGSTYTGDNTILVNNSTNTIKTDTSGRGYSLITGKQLADGLAGKLSNATTISINGTTQNLSSNPSFTVSGGSSLTAGLNTKIQNNVISNSQILTPADTFYILMSGQSNAGFSANYATVYDTLKNNNVQIWNWFPKKWTVAVVGKQPFTSSSYTTSGNSGWYFAKKINEMTGKKVKIVLHYHNATGIDGWHNGTAKQADLDSLITKATNSGVPKFDLFIWQQGESDPFANANYVTKFDSIKSNLRRQSFFPSTTPIVVVGMPQTKYGSLPGYQGAEKYLQAVDGNSDPWDIYANTDSCLVIPSNVHFTNAGLKKIGTEKILNAYGRLPAYANLSYITPSRVEIVHKDSANTNREGIVIRNTSAYGATGFLMNSYNNQPQFRLVAQNPSYTFTPFTANQNVISTENSKDLAIWANYAEVMRFKGDASQITAYKKILMYAASSALAQFKIGYGTNTDVGLMCTGASVSGSDNDFVLYTFGANNLDFYTNGARRLRISGTGLVQNQVGSTSTYATLGGTFNKSYADSSSVTTTETSLYGSVLPANSLVTNGDHLIYNLSGTYAANTNSKTLKIYYAGNLLETITQTTPDATLRNWTILLKLFRTSTSTARIEVEFKCYNITGTGVVEKYYNIQDVSGLSFATGYTIKTTGTGTTSGDIVGKIGYTEINN